MTNNNKNKKTQIIGAGKVASAGKILLFDLMAANYRNLATVTQG